MTHSIISRVQFLVLTCAVLATLVLVASRGAVGYVDPGACRTVSTGTSAATLASADDCSPGSSPIGYRLP